LSLSDLPQLWDFSQGSLSLSFVERETGLEPATTCLEGRDSTS
jgi:hypothetical protein